VFDLPEYGEYLQMTKKRVDINNLNDKKKQNDHLYSDILGQEKSFRSPLAKKSKFSGGNKQHNKSVANLSSTVTEKKFGQQRSVLDTHDFEPAQYKVYESALSPKKSAAPLNLNVKQSTALKFRDLSSDIMGIGELGAASKYAQSNPQDTKIVDLAVKGLSDNVQADDLKKISGAKHVISS
jgi:hypothetical protein